MRHPKTIQNDGEMRKLARGESIPLKAEVTGNKYPGKHSE